jgi:uncharacterized protein with von Willebrand factor type A (vWA) domain
VRPPAAELGLDFERAVVSFRRGLAEEGVACGPSRSALAAEALRALDERSRNDVYWALRSTLISRPEDRDAFDRLFTRFWTGQTATPLPPSRSAPRDPEAQAGRPRNRRGGDQGADAGGGAPADDGDGDGDETEVGEAQSGAVASAYERLGSLDFRAYGPEELALARRLITRAAQQVPRRRSRRLEPSHVGRRRIDFRRTVRDSMRTEGEPLRRAWRTRKLVPRRMVFLVDVSGSMRDYAVPILLFCQMAIRAGRGTETFAFGTRLTRLTPHLRAGSAAAALERAVRIVPDWAGGTRIGANLKAFNDDWGRSGMTRGAIVTIVSDGWERGDVGLLEEELARLQRTSRTLLWLNPLAGDSGYEPLAAGMAAALRHVDGFLPAHNIASLEGFVTRLAQLE